MESQKLQYSTLIYVLAILGLPLCCCVGFGAIPAGIAFFIANTELKKYYANPDAYTNQDSIYTGKIIALVILIINILYITYTAYQIYTIGWDNLMEQSRQIMEQYE
ncbi:hypothetical protein C7447_10270 [Tenacibaculum adriaticum]|uniref:Interferon-induced transmembrane protein n=1 Tax=Tenacibaculum adriaticum TaxID=413713 RepID=A0A5S5DSK6_9FLAO|nr:CCC motif membrane protein [Tenacibaculum adriaticum]TYP98755.1 hypothetical protein C7447_10270 [Tenacibaculum adriaticum]